MTDLLEQQLALLSDRLDLPAPQSLVDDVLARLPTTNRRRHVRTMALGIAAAVAAMIAVPTSRQAIGGWLTFGNTRIERSPSTSAAIDPTTPSQPADVTTVSRPSTNSPATSTDLDLGPGLSEATALEAAAHTGLPVPLLSGVTTPIGIFVSAAPEVAQVLVAYPPSAQLPRAAVVGVGVLLATSSAIVETDAFGKFLGGGTTIENIEVTTSNGDVVDAVWIAGAPHQYGALTADGQFVIDALRLATNTLLWVDDGVQYRLEANITRDAARQLAASVTIAP